MYHFPYATIGLIVANAVAFFASLAAEDPVPWMLAFGDGLHPAQWVTNIFMHADLLHLLGNMIFLWAFGLVIEGKIGWWRFLLVYVGFGGFESAVSQIGMLGGEGLALEASGAIEKRPCRALSVLEKIPAGTLNADLEKIRKQLEARARKMYDEGEIELDDEDW